MRLRSRPFLRTLPIAFLLAATAALAQDAPPWTDWSVATAAPDWRTWVAPDAGFALALPPAHALATSGAGVWYLHGHHDGQPSVPDATLRWLPETDLATALARTFPADAIAEPWRFGDAATRGLRVVARGAGPDGTPYSQAGYLIEGEGGVLRLSRYEAFDWAPFHAVAGSLRWVRIVTPEERSE
jgi:hypothetical protein